MIDARLQATAAAWHREDLVRAAARASVEQRCPRRRLVASLARARQSGTRQAVQPAHEARGAGY